MALTNAQYDAIMHQYEVKQQKSRDEAASHLAYVYEHIPGYRDLDQSTSDISVSFGMKLLNGEIQDRNWLKRKLSEVADRKKLLLQVQFRSCKRRRTDFPVCKTSLPSEST